MPLTGSDSVEGLFSSDLLAPPDISRKGPPIAATKSGNKNVCRIIKLSSPCKSFSILVIRRAKDERRRETSCYLGSRDRFGGQNRFDPNRLMNRAQLPQLHIPHRCNKAAVRWRGRCPGWIASFQLSLVGIVVEVVLGNAGSQCRQRPSKNFAIFVSYDLGCFARSMSDNDPRFEPVSFLRQ